MNAACSIITTLSSILWILQYIYSALRTCTCTTTPYTWIYISQEDHHDHPLIPSTLSYWLLRSTMEYVLRTTSSTGFSASKHCRWTNYCTVLCTEYTYSDLAVQYVHPEYSDIRKRKGTILSLSAPSTLDCWSISNDEIHTTIVPLHVNRFLTNRI